MFSCWFSRITMISLIISSFLGCCCRFICLMATVLPVTVSTAVKTVPEAPCPIFSLLVYRSFDTPGEMMSRSLDSTSSSLIFFLPLSRLGTGLAAAAAAAASPPPPAAAPAGGLVGGTGRVGFGTDGFGLMGFVFSVLVKSGRGEMAGGATVGGGDTAAAAAGAGIASGTPASLGAGLLAGASSLPPMNLVDGSCPGAPGAPGPPACSW
mmetsp:Transcript_16334/g.42407  ORF Transcript_16334/g.42407 Transcript_16334/m.42407 type:complete len:209 (-) Transcript_16334:283-909(-)